jgi:hypothetical protein
LTTVRPQCDAGRWVVAVRGTMGACEWIREGRGAVEIMKREEK